MNDTSLYAIEPSLDAFLDDNLWRECFSDLITGPAQKLNEIPEVYSKPVIEVLSVSLSDAILSGNSRSERTTNKRRTSLVPICRKGEKLARVPVLKLESVSFDSQKRIDSGASPTSVVSRLAISNETVLTTGTLDPNDAAAAFGASDTCSGNMPDMPETHAFVSAGPSYNLGSERLPKKGPSASRSKARMNRYGRERKMIQREPALNESLLPLAIWNQTMSPTGVVPDINNAAAAAFGPSDICTRNMSELTSISLASALGSAELAHNLESQKSLNECGKRVSKGRTASWPKARMNPYGRKPKATQKEPALSNELLLPFTTKIGMMAPNMLSGGIAGCTGNDIMNLNTNTSIMTSAPGLLAPIMESRTSQVETKAQETELGGRKRPSDNNRVKRTSKASSKPYARVPEAVQREALRFKAESMCPSYSLSPNALGFVPFLFPPVPMMGFMNAGLQWNTTTMLPHLMTRPFTNVN